MKKLNLNQLKNVNGCWPWEDPFPKAVYDGKYITHIHKVFGQDYCVLDDHSGKPTKVPAYKINAVIELGQVMPLTRFDRAIV